MAFQVKDHYSIVASMINWIKATTTKITDFTVGSVARTLLEAPAVEIDELYQQMFIGIKEAIPVATYESFNFAKKDAISATGLIRVTIQPSTTAVLISAGTSFSGAGLPGSYTSLADTIIAAGKSFIDVSVQADEPGSTGNIAAGRAFELSPSPNGFVSATNLSAFSSGIDEETDDERKTRFAAYIASISRGTNGALVYGLKTTTLSDADGNITERVVAAAVVEPYLADSLQPIANVECYVHNGVGSTTAALVAKAQQIMSGYTDTAGNKVEGYKAAGVPCTVYAATEVAVKVAGNLTAADGYDEATLITSAGQAVYAYIQSLDLGQSCLVAELVHRIKSIDGVYNITLTSPAADVAATAKQKLMPGAIALA